MVKRQTDRRSDHELVDACNGVGAKAATRAFEVLYKRHRDYVLRVAMRFSRDPEIAQDVLQETFSYLIRKFPPTGGGLELRAKMTTLLYPVAKNLAISAIRRANRLETSENIQPDDLPAPTDSDFAEDVLTAALSGLSSEHREVLTLRFVDDMSLAEIAQVLKIPLGTVKSRIHLAIKQLRDDPKIKDLFAP